MAADWVAPRVKERDGAGCKQPRVHVLRAQAGAGTVTATPRPPHPAHHTRIHGRRRAHRTQALAAMSDAGTLSGRGRARALLPASRRSLPPPAPPFAG
jgi:hypothetical protein